MVAKTLKFVDAPETTATVRMDLNNPTGGVYLANDGLDLGVPEFLGEPGGIGGEYGFRQITMTLRVVGTLAVATQAQSDIGRELARQTNWLLVQPSGGVPVWFKTYLSNPGALNLRLIEQGVWDLVLTVDADPFAVGVLQTQTVTISNNPANANGLVATLGSIVGDYPAPAIIDFPAGTTTYIQPYLSVFPLEFSLASSAWFWQGETATTSNSGQNITTGGTGYSGSGYANLTITPGTSTALARRFSYTVTAPYAGRWKLFARVGTPAVATSSTSWTVVGAGEACSVPNTTTYSTLGTAFAALVELGTYTFPKGNLPSSKPYTLDTAVVGIDIAGAAVGGTTNAEIRIDYIIAIPIDLPLDSSRGSAYTLRFREQTKSRGNVVLRLNGENGSVSEINAGKYGVSPGNGPELPAGSFPVLTPGAKNMLTLLTRRGLDTTPGFYNDVITTSTALSISYRPQWLHVGDA